MKRILAAVVAAMMLLCAMPVGVGAVEDVKYSTEGSYSVVLAFSFNNGVNNYVQVDIMNDNDSVNVQVNGAGNVNGKDIYYYAENQKIYRVIGDGAPEYTHIYVDENGTLVLDGVEFLCMYVMPYVSLASMDDKQKNPTAVIEIKDTKTAGDTNTAGDVYIYGVDVVFTGEGKLDVEIDQNTFDEQGSSAYYERLVWMRNGQNFSNFVATGASVTVDGPTINIDNTLPEGANEAPVSAGLLLLAFEVYDGTEEVLIPSALTIKSGEVNIVASDAKYESQGVSVMYYENPSSTMLTADEEEPYEFEVWPVLADITVNGGKLNAAAGKGYNSIGINASYANLVINGGEVNAAADLGMDMSVGISVGAVSIAVADPQELPVEGEFVINGGKVTATANKAQGISAGVYTSMADITLAKGQLTATGNEQETQAAARNSDASENIPLSGGLMGIGGRVSISKDIELILTGRGYAMALIPYTFNLEDGAYGEYAAKYNDNTYVPFKTEELANWNTLYENMDDENADTAIMEEFAKYQYIHLNGLVEIEEEEEEEQEETNFNLFLLMLMMAQIDVDITGEGTVTHDGNTRMAYFNKPRTFTITPAEGWEIADVLYEGESLGAVDTVEIIPTVRKSLLEVIFTEIPADDAE